MRRPYLDEYHAITEPLFLRPKDIKILDRKGGKWSIVKKSNGQIWDGDDDGGHDDKVKGAKVVLLSVVVRVPAQVKVTMLLKKVLVWQMARKVELMCFFIQ